MSGVEQVETTGRERFFLGVVRYNERNPTKYVARKGLRIGRLEVEFKWRRKHQLWGRFGGGWQWKLGVMVASRTLAVNMLVCSLSFALKNKETPPND